MKQGIFAFAGMLLIGVAAFTCLGFYEDVAGESLFSRDSEIREMLDNFQERCLSLYGMNFSEEKSFGDKHTLVVTIVCENSTHTVFETYNGKRGGLITAGSMEFVDSIIKEKEGVDKK